MFYIVDENFISGVVLWGLSVSVLYSKKTPKNFFILLGIFVVAISSIFIATHHSAGPLGLSTGMIFFLLGKLKYSYLDRVFEEEI